MLFVCIFGFNEKKYIPSNIQHLRLKLEFPPNENLIRPNDKLLIWLYLWNKTLQRYKNGLLKEVKREDIAIKNEKLSQKTCHFLIDPRTEFINMLTKQL